MPIRQVRGFSNPTCCQLTASSNLYSLIETAKANGLEPYAYLRKVFTQMPVAQSVEHIEALLPFDVSTDHAPTN